MYKLTDIKEIHLEITQRCQASCSMCDRNINGGDVNPHLNLDELSLSDIKKIFLPEFIKQLESLQMCGNYGDPIVAKDTLEVFKYFREHNSNIFLSMNTNAGARDENWWAELAKIFKKRGIVIFSVDGLEDTNHIYRQNVQWNIVKRSMQSFIAAGGRARWDFLVFDFNQHQVDQARQLSIDWGFEKFIVKKSSRFITGSLPTHFRQSVNRKTKEIFLINQPDSKFQNIALKDQDKLIEKYGTMDEYYDNTEILCRVQGSKSIYISAEGIVMPCCWTAGRMYKWWHSDPTVEQIWNFIKEAGGKSALNAKLVGIDGIFNTGIFENIKKSWDKSSCSNGKLKVCSMKCGKEFDVVGSQYK